MVEEILKALSENPEFVAVGAGAAYAGLTYLAGRMETYDTRKEAEAALEEVYDSPFDLLKGLYDKGKKDSAQAEIDLRQRDLYDPEPEALGLEPDEDIEAHWDSLRSNAGPEEDPAYGD